MKMASRSIDLISKKKKNKFAREHSFCLSLPLFCATATLFCRTKTSNVLVTNYFYGGIVVCAYPIFCLLCSCSLLFFTAAHFHLAGRSLLATSISHCPTSALKCHVFLPTKFFSFVFNHSLQLFLCYSRECNIKNNVEKETTWSLFFLSKSPGSHAIFFQIKPELHFGCHTC